MFFFSYLLVGDIMLLFIKGFVIGIAKIIPGVSGALIAINFGIYDKIIESLTDFFDDWKNNLQFLLIFGLGVLLAIIFGSSLVLYLLKNYFFVTMMAFLGLIVGGTYKFSLSIKYNKKNILLILILCGLFLFISLWKTDSMYTLQGNFLDNVMFFIGGIIEIFASIIPGVSGTALQMIIGIYDLVLVMISSVFNFSYVSSNINLYISYGLGMMFSFIITLYLIAYLLKKYRNTFNSMILGLSIASILIILMIIFNRTFTIIQFVFGIMLFFVGVITAFILDH